MAFVIRKAARLVPGDLPSFHAVPNADLARTADALPRACLLSLLAIGGPLAVYRSCLKTVFLSASACPDGAASDARDRARLARRHNALPRLVLSPRQAAALDPTDRYARRATMSSASSTRMTNGSKHEGCRNL